MYMCSNTSSLSQISVIEFGVFLVQHSSAKIGEGCRIGPSVVIGPNVVVEDGKLPVLMSIYT